MGLMKVGTFGGRIVFEEDGKSALFTKSEITAIGIADTAKLRVELAKKLGASANTPVFFHENRDGSLALATGAMPGVWPEDDVETKSGGA